MALFDTLAAKGALRAARERRLTPQQYAEEVRSGRAGLGGSFARVIGDKTGSRTLQEHQQIVIDREKDKRRGFTGWLHENNIVPMAAGALMGGAALSGLSSLGAAGSASSGGTAAGGATASAPAINWGGLQIPVSASQQAAIGTGALPGLQAAGLGGGMWEWLDEWGGGAYDNPTQLWEGSDVLDPLGQTWQPTWEGSDVMDPLGQGWQQPSTPLWEGSDLIDPISSTGWPSAPSPTVSIPGVGDVFGSWGSILKNAPGVSQLRSLLGGGNASGGGTAGRGILDGILNDPLGAAFNASPFLLALMEANRQSGDLNSVINKINGESYTRSVLNPYDMDTGIGRANMLQDQGLRGVRGSSFGNNDLTNYDYMRSLGRGDLANRANLASAGLEGNLINQRNTNRNLLLGAGLNASARLFSPPADPFGLNRLSGLFA